MDAAREMLCTYLPPGWVLKEPEHYRTPGGLERWRLRAYRPRGVVATLSGYSTVSGTGPTEADAMARLLRNMSEMRRNR